MIIAALPVEFLYQYVYILDIFVGIYTGIYIYIYLLYSSLIFKLIERANYKLQISVKSTATASPEINIEYYMYTYDEAMLSKSGSRQLCSSVRCAKYLIYRYCIVPGS